MKRSADFSLQLIDEPPKALLPWLVAQGSLTAQLERVLGRSLRVQGVSEGVALMSSAMTRQIDKGNRGRQVAVCREVELIGDQGGAWVAAQSWFPISALSGPKRRLKNLGATPLGYVLFDRMPAQCSRSVFEANEGWTRYNHYIWRGSEFIVAETFLPEFVNLIQEHRWLP